MNRDLPKSYLGLGAFNLVRDAAYRQSGGYQALRLTVVDDVKLGLLLRRAGKRTRGFLGVDDVVCHWGTTVGSMVKIMEKNYFAAIDFRVGLVLAGSALVPGRRATIHSSMRSSASTIPEWAEHSVAMLASTARSSGESEASPDPPNSRARASVAWRRA